MASASRKVIYCRNSHNKIAHAYLLTPSGIEEKAKLTARFLKQRMQDYEQIKREIAELEVEVNGGNKPNEKVSFAATRKDTQE